MQQNQVSSNKPDPIVILEEILKSRQKKNAAYTKTALARDMGISQPLLSLILSRRRSLTTVQAKKTALLLNLTSAQENELVEATLYSSDKNSRLRSSLAEHKSKRDSNRYVSLEFDRFSALAKWYHMPLLALVTTKDFKNNPAWIARRLGISTEEAREALERLIRLGLVVENEKGVLRMSEDRVELTSKKSEASIREHHSQMMKKAEETMKNNIDDESFAKRDISSLSLAIDPDKVSEAKALIKRFKEDLSALLTEGNVREVYQINLQLFPLSKE